MNKLIIALCGFLMLFAVQATATSHGSITTVKLTYLNMQTALHKRGIEYASPEMEALLEQYKVPTNKAEYGLLHTAEYKAMHLKAVESLEVQYAKMQRLGMARDLPNPSFLRSEDEAKHEYMPALYELAVYLQSLESFVGVEKMPAEMAVYYQILQDNFSYVHADVQLVCNTENYDQDAYLTDRTNEMHYKHLHELGGSVLYMLNNMDELQSFGMITAGDARNLEGILHQVNPEAANEILGKSDGFYRNMSLAILGLCLLVVAVSIVVRREQGIDDTGIA